MVTKTIGVCRGVFSEVTAADADAPVLIAALDLLLSAGDDAGGTKNDFGNCRRDIGISADTPYIEKVGTVMDVSGAVCCEAVRVALAV